MGTHETVEAEGTDRAGRSPVPGRGVLTALTGAAAIEETERRICGVGASHTVGAAEGAAMAGRRAATLLATPGAYHHTDLPPADAVVVHHSTGGETDADSVRHLAFELIAGSAQEAVDHCLVGHLLVAAAGGAGICTADRSIIEDLHLLRLPDEETTTAVLGQTAPGATVAAPGERQRDLLKAAPGLFASVAASTGRPCEAVVSHHLETDGLVLVAAGPTRVQAQAVARQLRSEGVPCGVVGVALAYPHPVRRLRDALSESAAIAVLGSGGGPDLVALVRRSLAPPITRLATI